MRGMEDAGNILVLAATVGPFILACRLAGHDARRNLVGVDLLLAGAAGGAIGLFGAFVPGVLYILAASYNVLPVPGVVLDSNHMEWAFVGLLLFAMVIGAWIGYIGGLAYEVCRTAHRRTAAVVLLSPLAIYLAGTGLVAAFTAFGLADKRVFDAFPVLGIPALLAALAGVWLLATQDRHAKN